MSASVDGLMCIFNTLGEINDDDGLDMVRYFEMLLISSYSIGSQKLYKGEMGVCSAVLFVVCVALARVEMIGPQPSPGELRGLVVHPSAFLARWCGSRTSSS